MASEPASETGAAPDDLVCRAIGAYGGSHGVDARARRAFLRAIQDLTLCLVSAWNRMRERGSTSEALFADLAQARFQIAERREQVEILAACRAEMEPRKRNHYTPSLRFRIVEHMRRYMLSIEETADRFVVTSQTIRNWLAELEANPGAATIGKPLLDPQPPIQRLDDGVRRLVQAMKDAGVGGKRKIALTLMRLGWKASPRTVGRIVKEPPLPQPPPCPETKPRETIVRGRYPNHLILIDVTRVPVLFPFLFVHVMVVLDAFSRLLTVSPKGVGPRMSVLRQLRRIDEEEPVQY